MQNGCMKKEFKIHKSKKFYTNQKVALDWLQFQFITINICDIASAKKQIERSIFVI